MKRVAVVTGAAIGIGLAVANNLANAGYHIVAVDVDTERLDETHAKRVKLGLSGEIIAGNLTDSGTYVQAAESCFNLKPNHWVLVNNASNRKKNDLLSETRESWSEQVEVMLSVPFYWSQNFLEYSLSHDSSGSICNISSVAARLTTGESPAYHAAKAGLEALTRYMAVHIGLLGANIRVNSVAPGLVIKEWNAIRRDPQEEASWKKLCDSYQPGTEFTTESDLANVIRWLVDKDNRSINGIVIPVENGATVQDQFFVASRVSDRLKDKYEPKS